MAETWIIDPTSEDATNTQLDISDQVNFWLLSTEYPTPPIDALYAQSVDTEGSNRASLRYQNREVTGRIRVTGSSVANLETQFGKIQQKCGKLNTEGGTLKRTSQSGTAIVFDVLEASCDVPVDRSYITNFRAEVTVKFVCRPFARAASATVAADNAETTLPAIVFTVASIPGDVPALGKLVIDEDQAVDQWFVMYGVQSRYYDAATTAKLYYEAEALTPLGTAAAAVGPTGASGAGSNTILQNALTTTYAGVLSTQATGGGAHMSHVGDFRVWARVQTPTANTGAVSVRLDWAEGDFRRHNLNPEVAVYPDSTNIGAWEGTWRLVDLGLVHLTKVPQGTQRWEGRVLGKSTVAGDDLYVDCLFIMPVTEGYGEVRAVQQFETVTAFSARDEFDQVAGVLLGKAPPVGTGTWDSNDGEATDGSVEDVGHTLQRTALSDTDRWFALCGTGTLTNTIVQADVSASVVTSEHELGVLARYTDISNYVRAFMRTADSLVVSKEVAGVTTILAQNNSMSFAASAWYTIRLSVSATGRFAVWFFPRGSDPGEPVLSGSDSALATGGGIASGRVGLVDYSEGAVACTRSYDNFLAAASTSDAAVFASQSLEIRHDRVIREDSGGTFWNAPSRVEGDYLLVPPAGREGRTARFIVKGSRGDPDTMADGGIDDISARLTYTPRYLVVPE